MTMRRLPSRKRTRSAECAAEQADVSNDVLPASMKDPLGGSSTAATAVSLELLTELVQNGTMAPHFQQLYDSTHDPGFAARRHVEIEVEVGSVVATVLSVNTAGRTAEGMAGIGTAGGTGDGGLLMRAFHRRKMQPPTTASAGRVSPSHCLLADTLSLEDWAPTNVIHAVKALAACGIHFQGPAVCLQTTDTVVTSAPLSGQPGGATRRIHVAHRRRHVYRSGDTESHHGFDVVDNWKAKQLLPVTYPGFITETVQIAWESEQPTPPESINAALSAEDLVGHAWTCGILPCSATRCHGPDGEVGRNHHLRLEWTTTVAERWLLVLRLSCLLDSASPTDAAELEASLRAAARPRGAVDVGRWLQQVVRVSSLAADRPLADWRLEVEMRSPATPGVLTHGLYLHHLLRALILGGSIDPVLHVGTASTVLSRQQFILHFEKHFGGEGWRNRDPEALFARDWLARVFQRAGLAVHQNTRYPIQPRPYDITARDFHRLRHCAVTPKVNGYEAFLVVHAYACAVVRRSGDVSVFPRSGMYPIILEGEVLGEVIDDGVLTFVAYDCVLTPTFDYIHRTRYGARQAALRALLALWEPVPGLRVLRKPSFPLPLHPARMLRACQAWSKGTGIRPPWCAKKNGHQRSLLTIPCDGVILADLVAPAYATSDRLFKLKDIPTIDYALCLVNGQKCVFELMLRAGEGSLQSLHRFRTRDDPPHTPDYVLPVLVHAEGMRSGQVVELGVTVGADRIVSFPTMQLREAGKPPNYLWNATVLEGCSSRPAASPAAMDIVHAQCSVARLLEDDNPVLNRVCIEGPLRQWKNAMLRQGLAVIRPDRLVELGAGRGGDTHVWVHGDTVRHLDVVDIDAESLVEYARRLRHSYHAEGGNDPGEWWVPANVMRSHWLAVRLHTVDAVSWTLDPGLGTTLVVLSFSLSQMFGTVAETLAFVQRLLGGGAAQHVLLIVHDHLSGGLPPPTDSGVQAEIVAAACCDASWWCDAHGRGARVRTHVLGSTLARGIEEWVCHSGALEAAFRVAGLRVITSRPFVHERGAHWLLRSLVMLHLSLPIA